MKKENILKATLVFAFSVVIIAQSAALTLNIEKAGTLSSLVDASQKFTTADLILTGYLNGTDLRFLRLMAGMTWSGDSVPTKLSRLDLSKAKIVSGGDSYYYDDHSFDDEFPDNLFSRCNQLKTVIIPNSVTSIGKYCFANCIGLDSIAIPQSVTTIEEKAFQNCSAIKSITIPSNVDSIGDNVFSGCTGLTSVIINNSIIVDGQFGGCYHINSITLSNKVTTIGNNAFCDCKDLKSITIPNSVVLIKPRAFFRCNGLQEIHCNVINPPEYCTYGVDVNTCVLYVPIGSYSLYRNASGWSEFINIIEERSVLISERHTNNISIYSMDNQIIIKGVLEGEKASVYNVFGNLVRSITASGQELRIEAQLNKFYIVKVANRAFKVAL